MCTDIVESMNQDDGIPLTEYSFNTCDFNNVLVDSGTDCNNIVLLLSNDSTSSDNITYHGVTYNNNN